MALIGHWPLNGHTNDITNNNSTTETGSIIYSNGKIGKAIDFNGSSNFISAPEISTYLHGKPEASIALWIRKKSNQYGFLQLSGYSNTNGNLYPYQTETKVYLDVFRTNRLGPIEMNTSTLEWHHVVITQSPGVWKLYQNGVLVHETTANSTVSTNYSEFEIGRNSTSRYANALFNDVRVYDHELTLGEIQELAQCKIVHYSFTENSGGEIYDKTGYGNGTELNSTYSATWSELSPIGRGSYYFSTQDNGIVGLTNFPSAILTNCTISYWRKNDAGTARYVPICGQTGSHYLMAYNGGNFYHSGLAGTPTIYIDGVNKGTAIASPTDTEWHHYVATGVNFTTWSEIRIGGYSSGWTPNSYYTDFRLYNSVLSDDDIKQLYQKRASLGRDSNFQTTHIYEDINLVGPAGIRKKGLYTKELSNVGELNGLVAYWNLKDAISDVSGNNHSAIPHSVTKVSEGATFNGANSYIDCGTSPDLRLHEGGSISAYVKLNSWNGTSWSNVIIGKGSSSWPNHHYILFKPAGEECLIISTSNGSNYLNGGGPRTGTLSLNTWYHVVATWDGINVKMYLDGSLSQSVASTIMPTSSTSNPVVSIGKTGNNGYYFDGTIDHVKLFNRALTKGDILLEYERIKNIESSPMRIHKDGTVFIRGQINEDL